MTREEQKEHTKRKILDNALTEFAERGYGGSSVNHIYDPAQGISKGLLYHYFSTKDEMFLACVEECFARLKEHIHSSLSAAPVPHTMGLAWSFFVNIPGINGSFVKRPLCRRSIC